VLSLRGIKDVRTHSQRNMASPRLMAVPAHTKVRRFMYFINASALITNEELLDDPEIDVVYNPVGRIFLKSE
jgi:hypothetical protein